MAADRVRGEGTRESPWVLLTPSLGSEYKAFRDEALDPSALVGLVGKTEVRYHFADAIPVVRFALTDSTMYPTVHSFRASGGVIATAEA